MNPEDYRGIEATPGDDLLQEKWCILPTQSMAHLLMIYLF